MLQHILFLNDLTMNALFPYQRGDPEGDGNLRCTFDGVTRGKVEFLVEFLPGYLACEFSCFFEEMILKLAITS